MFAKLRTLIRDMLGVGWLDRRSVDPAVIKAQIPRSWFTKRGPGVTAKAYEVFLGFTAEQQAVAVEYGWFPPTWKRKLTEADKEAKEAATRLRRQGRIYRRRFP